MSKKDKFKKVMKYTMNILAFIDAIIVGITPIWNIPYGIEISKTISVVMGAIGVYLLGQKGATYLKNKKGE